MGANDLTGKGLVHVFYVESSWAKDGVVKGWRLIVEHKGDLYWTLTYHSTLATTGVHTVEFGKNSRYEPVIKPAKD